jgi:hypothetical protein
LLFTIFKKLCGCEKLREIPSLIILTTIPSSHTITVRSHVIGIAVNKKLHDRLKQSTLPKQNTKAKYRPFALSDIEIFGRIWIQPASVLGYVNEYRYDRYTLLLLVITAVAGSLELAIAFSLGERMTLPVLLAVCFFLGGLLGLVAFYIYAAVVSWTGDWFDGLGSVNALVRVFAYAMFPMVFILLLVIAKILVFGAEIFEDRMDLNEYDSKASGFYLIACTIELTLVACSFYLTVIGVSQAQRFSTLTSLLNVTISALILCLLAGAIALPFSQ